MTRSRPVFPRRYAVHWTAAAPKVLLACKALPVEVAMKLADSAESGDCQTNREIVKYLFVSSHIAKRLPSPQFRRYENQVRGRPDEPGGRPQITYRTNR
jgi:hypothetical protein